MDYINLLRYIFPNIQTGYKWTGQCMTYVIIIDNIPKVFCLYMMGTYKYVSLNGITERFIHFEKFKNNVLDVIDNLNKLKEV